MNWNWKFQTNVFVYIVASCLFVVGSILFIPHLSTSNSLYEIGVLTFIIGSVLYCFGSMQLLLANFQSISPNYQLLVPESKPLDFDLAVSFCRNTAGIISGLLFIIGSVALWPTFGQCAAPVAGWAYICGSCLGVVNYAWLLFLLQMKSWRFSFLKLLTLLSLLSTIGFIISSGYLLSGGKRPVVNSFAVLSGSILSLLSSILVYEL